MHTLGIPFDEVVIVLRQLGTAAAIAAHSPSGKIPVLVDRSLGPVKTTGGSATALTIWDTGAIFEHLADQHPDLAVWPADPAARAIARSVSAEMHAGFSALRQHCPMDFNARGLTPTRLEAVAADVTRILAIWCDCRARFGDGGPYLFGAFSAADAMYAPVVSRFTTYEIDLGQFGDVASAAAYMASIRSLKGWATWAERAATEAAA